MTSPQTTEETTTTQTLPPPPVGTVPPPSQSDDYQSLKAQQKAAKAHAKAMRPWYRKNRFWLLGVVVLIAGIGIASAGGGSSESTAKASDKATTESVSKGYGSRDASADVKVGAAVNDDALGWGSAPVTVTNNSSEPSDYLITVAAQTADGKTQIDTAYVAVDRLEAGQSTEQTAQFTKEIPAGSKVVVTEVSRTASL